jgi:hypothetical protein
MRICQWLTLMIIQRLLALVNLHFAALGKSEVLCTGSCSTSFWQQTICKQFFWVCLMNVPDCCCFEGYLLLFDDYLL